MARTLVTGGAGFLGSHLCEKLLDRGDHVVCVDNLSTGRLANIDHLRDRPEFELHVLDVSAGLDGIGGEIDNVMHLASPASPVDFGRIPIEILLVGSAGTHNCLELARRHGARFLLASTSEVYGDPLVHPQTESYWGNVNPIGHRGVYDEAKRFAEAMAAAFQRVYDVEVRIVRIFNTYGPRMRADDGRVVSNFVTQALRGDPLTVYGDGLQSRSFCYVDDQIAGQLALLASNYGGPMNIGSEVELTMLELATIVLGVTNSSSGIVHAPLPHDDPTRRRPELTVARRELAWEPSVSITEGITRTARYFERVLAETF